MAWLPQVGLVLLIGIVIWAGVSQLSPPAAEPATIPSTNFSATRAADDLAIIAASSRGIGMTGHAESRQYLIESLTSMGLEPEVQQTTSILRFEGADAFSAGMVQNIVARVPGSNSTGVIVLNAHYDSGETGPGAADCGACVATVLESVRALQAGPALRNDVFVVFTDAEEHGDLGAAAFTTQHPWGSDVRLALNYEAQGIGGPAVLYATSSDNGWLIEEFLDVAPNPAAYSLMPEIVSALPGQRLACDLQDYLDRGSAGLGFVFMDESSAYHTQGDNVAAVDRGSMQQQGDYTVAVVQHFGNLDLSDLPRSDDAVFFNILPGRVVSYSGAWLIALPAISTIVALALLVAGYRRGRFTLKGLGAGALACLVGSVVTIALIAIVWAGMRMTVGNFQAILVGSYRTSALVIGFTILAFATMGLLYAALRPRLEPVALAAGAIVAWLPLTWLVTLAAPGASYILIWPLLFALVPLGLAVDGPQKAWPKVAALAVAAIPIFLLLPSTAYAIVAILNRLELMSSLAGSPPMLGLWALFVAPLATLLALHFDFLAGGSRGRARWLLPGTLAVVGIGVLMWATVTSGFSVEQPRPTHIAYELDAEAGTARWLSLEPDLAPWTEQFFPGEPGKEPYEFSAGFERDAYAAAAPIVDVPAPIAAISGDRMNDDTRRVDIQLISPRQAPLLDVRIEGEGVIAGATLDGQTMDLADYAPAREGTLWFEYVALPAEGVLLTLEVEGSGPLTVELADITYGLPEIAGFVVEPRPEDAMPAPALPLDGTTVKQAYTI
jgi:hypothetical protein